MYIERLRYTDALREFDADIRLDPGRAAFYRFKALASLALDRRVAAADAFRSARLADPADPQSAYEWLVHAPARTPAAERKAARDTLASLERALVRAERGQAESPFMSVRAINDDVGGAMVFAPAHTRARCRCC
jgi:hypothetical protein